MTIPSNSLKIGLCACMITMSLTPSHAAIPCPVSFLSGMTDANGISLSFRNKGKLPIQQVEITCAVGGVYKHDRSICHEETGLFFPGNSYDLTFLYPRVGDRSVQIALRAARLSDGSVWHSTRDQQCRPLKISQHKNPATQ